MWSCPPIPVTTVGKPRTLAETPLGILARRRGYAISWNRSLGAWLTWRDGAARAGDVPFETVFAPARFRRSEPASPFDVLHLFLADGDRARWEAEEALAAELAARIESGSGPPLSELNAGAQAASEHLDRIIARTAEPLARAESVLRVWLVETEQAILADDEQSVLARVKAFEEARYRHNAKAGIGGLGLDPRTSEKSARQMRDQTLARAGDGTGHLLQQARYLWDYTVYGTSEDGSERDPAGALLRFYDSLSAPVADGGLGTPVLIAEAQRRGLASAARDLVALRAEMRTADLRRVALERAKLTALEGLPRGLAGSASLPNVSVSTPSDEPVLLPGKNPRAKWGPLAAFIERAISTAPDRGPAAEARRLWELLCASSDPAVLAFCEKHRIDEDALTSLSPARWSEVRTIGLSHRQRTRPNG